MSWKKKGFKGALRILSHFGASYLIFKLTDEGQSPKRERKGGGKSGSMSVERLAREVLEKARSKGQTVAVAESCTGGLLGGALSSIPGASDVFKGGVICYQNEIKIKLLGVNKTDLERVGPVSQIVAEQMAAGAMDKLGAQIGVGITGFAGPPAALEPVGLVWVGLAFANNIQSRQWQFGGTRDEVREQAVRAALLMVRENLNK